MLNRIYDNDFQMKLYYLFMLADGECTDNELKLLDKIVEPMELKKKEREAIRKFAENIFLTGSSDDSCSTDDDYYTANNDYSTYNEDYSELVIKHIKELLSEKGYAKKFYRSQCGDKVEEARMLSTLINLGYADVSYSKPEKKVVAFLKKYWEADDAMIQAMIDTADTLLIMTKQKEWLQTTDQQYCVIRDSIQEVDDNINRLFNNIEVLISEAEIA